MATSAATRMMMTVTMVIAATNCCIEHSNTIASLLDQASARLMEEYDLVHDLVAGLHVNKKRKLFKRYLTRRDLGVDSAITRKIAERVRNKTYDGIVEANAFLPYTRLQKAEFDELLGKRHAWKKNEKGQLMTLAELVALPCNIARKGKKRFTHEEVLERSLKRKNLRDCRLKTSCFFTFTR